MNAACDVLKGKNNKNIICSKEFVGYRPPIPMAHFPQPPLLEYRIMEMNKRMYSFYHPQVKNYIIFFQIKTLLFLVSGCR